GPVRPARAVRGDGRPAPPGVLPGPVRRLPGLSPADPRPRLRVHGHRPGEGRARLLRIPPTARREALGRGGRPVPGVAGGVEPLRSNGPGRGAGPRGPAPPPRPPRPRAGRPPPAAGPPA